MDTLETIATRLHVAGAVFSVHAPPLTSLSFIQPLPPGALGDIARMTCVEELYLGGSDVTDDDVAQLVGLNRLLWLELSDTRVSNRSVELAQHFPQLKTLMLFGTKIDDGCLPHLERIISLREVGLDDTQVTTDGLARLQRSRPDLEIT